MITATLAIDYVTQATTQPWVHLEQLPVADNSLGLKDLARMLALVRSGVSAHAYRQPNCPCSVYEGTVDVPLEFFAWPSAPVLPYTLQTTHGELGAAEAIMMEREFSVVVDFNRRIDLPFFIAADFTCTWADMPCFDRWGNEVDRPAVTVDAVSVQVTAEVLGVLRIRCVAIGFRHALQVVYPKTSTTRVSAKSPQVTATWGSGDSAGSTTISLDIPGCVSDLLTTCDDGTLLSEASNGGQVSKETGKVPVIYFNKCTGAAYPVQYQRP